MGFNDQEIVALSGAHTLGRAFKERSGTVDEGYGDRNATKYTKSGSAGVRGDGKPGVGMAGGRSWSTQWLAFNNGYYGDVESANKELLQLSTDKVLFVDSEFRKYADLYGRDQSKFFEDYVKAHCKLSECGSKFRPSQGFYL